MPPPPGNLPQSVPFVLLPSPIPFGHHTHVKLPLRGGDAKIVRGGFLFTSSVFLVGDAGDSCAVCHPDRKQWSIIRPHNGLSCSSGEKREGRSGLGLHEEQKYVDEGRAQ